MEAIMNGIETKQEAVMKFTCEEECNKEVQVRSEITVTTGNQASLEPRGSIIPDDRIQERNSEMCGINSTVQKYGPIKTKTVENSNSSGGNNVKSTFCVVNTDKELITEDCADTNEQNRNRVVECHSSEGSGTIVMSDNCSTEEGGTEEYKKSLADKSKRRMLLVLPDSDSDYEGYLNNVCPRLEEEQFPVHETSHLTLEEAFFVSFGLGCLQVIDLFGNCLSLAGMWQLFCKAQKDFVQKYVTYHYFRSKGWVVKPGVKFGGDFCKLEFYVTFSCRWYVIKTKLWSCGMRHHVVWLVSIYILKEPYLSSPTLKMETVGSCQTVCHHILEHHNRNTVFTAVRISSSYIKATIVLVQ
jgi:tRNA splicing endonuclease